MVEEAIRSGLRFKAVFFRESAQDVAGRLLPQINSRVETVQLPDEVFASAVATESPQGVAALVKLKAFELDDVFRRERPLVVGVSGIQDPGNLGTILRSAEAFGAAGLLLLEKTVSPLNAKALRASAGSVFRLPVIAASAVDIMDKLKQRGLTLLATSSHKGRPAAEMDFRGAVALFIGGEGAGLPREVLARVDEVVAIPHSPQVESLNAAIAASILLYEAWRQRQ
ncbi:MAG: RNA methyltransferase [Acidobacteria bacterium]|nr:RNA methyltransferase [Acidobacteriota bacterium]